MEPLLIGEELAPPRRPDRSRARTGAEERRLPALPARKPAGLARRSRAVDELLLQQPDRRARHAPDRYRARPQGRLQQGRQEARSPARSQGAHHGPAMDRWRRAQRPRRSRPTPSAKSTAASANCCPTICCGSKTRRRKRRIKVIPGELRHRDVAVGRHVADQPARRAALPATLRGGLQQASAKPTPSSRPRRRITASSGFTRSSTATAASRG